MKNFSLTIITENQNNKIKAQKLADLICKTLKNIKLSQIEKYHKFENSYRIDLEKETNYNENISEQILEFAKKITSTWVLNFNDNIELIFNKNENTKFTRNEFNVINWMQIQIVENV